MLNRLAEAVAREASFRARKKISIDIAMNSVLFALSSLSSYARAHIGEGNNKRYVNYFGITFAMSGDGKDLTLSIAEEILGITKVDGQVASPYIRNVIANFESLNRNLPTGDSVNDNTDYIVPTQYKVALQGTKEGMMRVANFYNRTTLGSLNVISTEFGDELLNVTSLSLLTTLWQDAKADGSTNVNEKYKPVNDVPTNILLFGSPAPFVRDQRKHHNLAGSIESGLARRTFFVWEEKMHIEIYREESTFIGDIEVGSEVRTMISSSQDRQMAFSEEATNMILAYSNDLVDQYNEKMTDWSRIKISNIDKIERLSALSAMANMNTLIEKSDIEFAIEWSERSDESMKNVVMPKQQYISMYEELLIEADGLTVTEFIERGITFQNKVEKDLQVSYLSEYAYRKNMRIIEAGSRLVLVELELNKLDKMIISTSAKRSAKPEMEINFRSQEVNFFGEGMSVEALVTSQVQSFCLNHFEATDRAPDGYRHKKNVIRGQNMIGLDIDEGMTLEEAKERMSQYVYLIYTTKSHQKEKNGIVCDRFRVLIPTQTNYYVNPDEHKKMYENISVILDIPNYDIQTRNIGRLWYTNETSVVYTNKEGILLDVRPAIPETERAEDVMPKIESLKENVDDDELSRRIFGMQKYVIINGVKGARNDMIFRFAKFAKEIGASRSLVAETNMLLSDPLPENEVKEIVSRC